MKILKIFSSASQKDIMDTAPILDIFELKKNSFDFF